MASFILSPDLEGQQPQFNLRKRTSLLERWSLLSRSSWGGMASPFSQNQVLRQDTATSTLDISARASQCCFLCLQSIEGPYALQVPCIRPKLPRRIGTRLKKVTRDNKEILVDMGEEIFEKPSAKEKAFESDGAIWQRMNDTYYNDRGRWKAWLPFFGPTVVREVEFQFVGAKERNGRFRICAVTPVDIDRARKTADAAIAMEAQDLDHDYSNACLGNFHSARCPKSTDVYELCITDMAETARQRKRKLEMLFLLKECAQTPLIANGHGTLEGMAQDGCIYELEKNDRLIIPESGRPYGRTDRVRGIEIRMGWQIDRIKYYAPFPIAWALFASAIVWLGVIVWAGPTGDWDTAMAFGQLLAASSSLLVLYARD